MKALTSRQTLTFRQAKNNSLTICRSSDADTWQVEQITGGNELVKRLRHQSVEAGVELDTNDMQHVEGVDSAEDAWAMLDNYDRIGDQIGTERLTKQATIDAMFRRVFLRIEVELFKPAAESHCWDDVHLYYRKDDGTRIRKPLWRDTLFEAIPQRLAQR